MHQRLQIISPAPILNTPDFSFAFGGPDGKTIPTNERGLPHFFEFVALKGEVFELLEICSPFIVRVSHPAYKEPNLFIDRRFTIPSEAQHTPLLPDAITILARMEQMVGKPYVWGGNWGRGIPALFSLYPPKGELDPHTKALWGLAGVDCSGLLYEATDGATPRNTSELLKFGKPLNINGLEKQQWIALLRPLDMILYKGHVLFVLDAETTIESRFPYGVILRDLGERLDEILSEKNYVETWDPSTDPHKQFTIRRFVEEVV